MKINVNDNVRIKLTDKGRKVLEAKHHALYEQFPQLKKRPYEPPKEDAEGWSVWQLWCVMEAFGEFTRIGMDGCFETTMELVLPST